MEKTIYQVRVIIICENLDMDMCPRTTDEVIADILFASKVKAIAKAQSIFAKRPLNSVVRSVWSMVYSVRVADNGHNTIKRIYNKYKYNA